MLKDVLLSVEQDLSKDYSHLYQDSVTKRLSDSIVSYDKDIAVSYRKLMDKQALKVLRAVGKG